MNNRGFSLIELLIALLIILIASLGVIKGILEYEKFSIRGKMKAQATQILEQTVSEIAKYPYPGENAQSILHPYYWINQICNEDCTGITNCCSFENIDADDDGIPDFYDPYTGTPDLANPFSNLNPYLRLKPSSTAAGSMCSCSGINCPNSGLPDCVYQSYARRNIYVAVNVAEIISPDTPSLKKGRYASVIVWYFEPFTDKLQQMSAVVFKSGQGL
ncbi:MAG: prepilin-type N-terminal cleavage/methylation domain-containing protein [Thermodesulfovibrio sp.]|nr:prepilin-type N-terminal cleavage/methylation domain-containing protein [Thermodesulfovibrio sp.]